MTDSPTREDLRLGQRYRVLDTRASERNGDDFTAGDIVTVCVGDYSGELDADSGDGVRVTTLPDWRERHSWQGGQTAYVQFDNLERVPFAEGDRVLVAADAKCGEAKDGEVYFDDEEVEGVVRAAHPIYNVYVYCEAKGKSQVVHHDYLTLVTGERERQPHEYRAGDRVRFVEAYPAGDRGHYLVGSEGEVMSAERVNARQPEQSIVHVRAVNSDGERHTVGVMARRIELITDGPVAVPDRIDEFDFREGDRVEFTTEYRGGRGTAEPIRPGWRGTVIATPNRLENARDTLVSVTLDEDGGTSTAYAWRLRLLPPDTPVAETPDTAPRERARGQFFAGERVRMVERRNALFPEGAEVTVVRDTEGPTHTYVRLRNDAGQETTAYRRRVALIEPESQPVLDEVADLLHQDGDSMRVTVMRAVDEAMAGVTAPPSVEAYAAAAREAMNRLAS